MSYVLEPAEALGTGLRRTLMEEITGAADGLEQASESDWNEAVHEARKSLKKGRALLRLARAAMGPLYGEANVLLRDVGRSLSEVRDAEVMVATIDKFAEVGPKPAIGELVEPVRRVLVERRDRVIDQAKAEGVPERAAKRIRHAGALLTKVSWERADWEVIETGLKREYGRGRSAFEAARRNPEGDATHEWRKRVKDHWYHLRLVRKGWSPVLKRTAKAAHTVSDLLGDEHDLAVLMDELHANEGDLWNPAWADSISTLAERKRGELFAEAVPLGRRLYAERPTRFAARIHRYWKATDSEIRLQGDLQTRAAGA
jgi:CHAD domain-containing protein